MQFQQDTMLDWKIMAFESAKIDTARQAYMVTVLWTGLDRFGQVWTGLDRFGQVRTGLDKSEQVWRTISSSTMSRTLSTLGLPHNLHAVFLSYLAQNSTTLHNGGNSSSWHCSRRKVCTGRKCNFSSAHFLALYIVAKLSISRVWMCRFTRIRRKTKKFWL